MALNYEFILLGFCVGVVVWAVCRVIGYIWQCTRIPFGLTE